MITDIKIGNTAPAIEQDAVDMLLACHQRIRSFTALAERLAEATGASAPEVASAAESVHRYYSVALPLHEADENDSVYPRLRERLAGTAEAASLQAMVDQHGPIDAVVAQLLPRWERLRSAPEQLSSCADDIRRNAARLQELWREHLALEEEVVFPLLRTRLTPGDLQAIHHEMKQRRGIE